MTSIKIRARQGDKSWKTTTRNINVLVKIPMLCAKLGSYTNQDCIGIERPTKSFTPTSKNTSSYYQLDGDW
jgi:hypothetical protein